METLAYITSPTTVRLFDLSTGKQVAFIPFTGDEEDALMAIHDEGWMTVGSQWNTSGDEPCIEVQLP